MKRFAQHSGLESIFASEKILRILLNSDENFKEQSQHQTVPIVVRERHKIFVIENTCHCLFAQLGDPVAPNELKIEKGNLGYTVCTCLKLACTAVTCCFAGQETKRIYLLGQSNCGLLKFYCLFTSEI